MTDVSIYKNEYRKISNISRIKSPNLNVFSSRRAVVFAQSNETSC